MKYTLVFAVLVAPVSSGLSGRIHACCPAFPKGVEVQIADQEILIVYDRKTRTEHFVRRANFDTGVKDFGFLVPTPAIPELAEAPNEVFDRLHDVIRPEIRRVNDFTIGSPALLLSLFVVTMSANRGALDISKAVRVLHEQRVAGYDAVVLEADDPKALAGWLRSHDYSTRPALEEWLAPYVKAGWKVTAFKYAVDSEDASTEPGVSTSSVRMSFATDRPLFPYRVPTDQLGKRQGLLRVFYVGDRRMTGVLGYGASPWEAETKYSNGVENMASKLRDAIPTQSIPDGAWLTALEDHRWPGGTEDLFFVPSADGSPVTPAPIQITNRVQVPLMLDVVAIGCWWWLRRRRKRAAA